MRMKVTSYRPALNAGGQPTESLYPEFDFKYDGNLTLANLLCDLSTHRDHIEKIIAYLNDDSDKLYFIDSNCSLEKVTAMQSTMDNELVAILIGLDDGDEGAIAGQIINRLELIDVLKQWDLILEKSSK